MQPYQERVVAESNELRERLTKLTAFITADAFDAFDALAEEDQILMVRQQRLMAELLETLRQRIARFV